MANESNLIRLTSEKAREIGAKGGKRSGEVRRLKKTFKMALIETLETKIETSKTFVEKLEKALKTPIDKSDNIEKIKEFINELEHNKQVDKNTDDTLISGVSCDYVIEKLKDIIE